VRRELRYGLTSLRRRPTLALAAWSMPEMLPTAGYGFAVAHAMDDGFLAGRPGVGLVWLGGLLVAAAAGAVGSRQVYRRLGGLVEPVRDDLVARVVSGALRGGVAGRRDDGSVAQLTRQVEIVRDTYAGMILVLRSFLISVAGVVTGLLAIEPVIALLVLPPFLLGFAASVAILGLAASRVRASIRADEELTTSAGTVFSGVRESPPDAPKPTRHRWWRDPSRHRHPPSGRWPRSRCCAPGASRSAARCRCWSCWPPHPGWPGAG
jgi:ATP-binding cassette, subfamily C, bacterial